MRTRGRRRRRWWPQAGVLRLAPGGGARLPGLFPLAQMDELLDQLPAHRGRIRRMPPCGPGGGPLELMICVVPEV